jgi:hypothetical protein
VNTGKDERGKIFAMDNEFRSQPYVKSVGTGYSYPGSSNIYLNLFAVELKMVSKTKVLSVTAWMKAT